MPPLPLPQLLDLPQQIFVGVFQMPGALTRKIKGQ